MQFERVNSSKCYPQESSGVQRYTPPPDADACESWRSSINKNVAAYVKEHFPNGVLTVSPCMLVHNTQGFPTH